MTASGLSTDVKRILVVDDHPVVREGIAALVGAQADLAICGQADGLEQALRQCRETNPDLIVVDISLKSENGLELIRELMAWKPDVKILVSSVHDDSLYAERALRVGARGYVRKNQPTEDILAAIRRILADRIYLSEQATERLLRRNVARAEGPDASPLAALSDRELEVFECIGRGLSTRMIADRLHVSPKTVESHREKIKAKLGLDNGRKLMRQAVAWLQANSH